jgi:hypothetical protein
MAFVRPYLCIVTKKGNMKISDDRTIKSIQAEFNSKFPYLKLEFYNKAHEVGEGSQVKSLIDVNQTIGAVRSIHTEGDLSINGHLKVATLEQNFAEMYGLNAQVFRDSNGLWLQTTSTDDWTLTDQNRRGAEFRN